MLRLRAATSMPEDFTSGSFQPVIDDPRQPAASDVRRIILASGKAYYDLDKRRDKDGRGDVAIVRWEQLYPLPADELRATFGQYSSATEVVWVQDEPANQGPWPYVALNLPKHLDGLTLRRVSRGASASPAAGSHNAHESEQHHMLDEAFG